MKFSEEIEFAWKIGDWHLLSGLNLHELKSGTFNSSNLQAVALQKAVAHFQLNQNQEAASAIQFAQQEGADDEMLAKYLLSGLYQTFAEHHVSLHSTASAAAYLDAADNILSEQHNHIEQPKWLTEAQIIYKQKENQVSYKAKHEVSQVIELGEAWAGNSVNTVIFRHHGVFTYNTHQYSAFYIDHETLRIIKRDLKSNEIENHDIKGSYNLRDAHNSISLGIDRKGRLHISYDHHGNKLNYRRSCWPENISKWSDLLPMTGRNEERVTYPAFILPTEHTPLMLLYRDGNWKQGSAHIKYFDESLEQWFDYPNPILSGADNKPWTSNAYWNHPSVDKNGILHLSYTWRTDYFSEEELISNINIDYAKSFDGGLNWVTSKDQPYKLPITPTNSETVWPISPGSNHINQTSMALDSKGFPHIVFYANDLKGIPQYQHLWFDGVQWQQSYVTRRTRPFKLCGGGTLEIPISRPEIVIDKDDTVFIIYRAEETDQKLVASYQTAPRYECMPDQTVTVWEENIGHAEPIVDRARWQQEQILTLLVQYNEQPNGDIEHQQIFSTIRLIDIQFKK